LLTHPKQNSLKSQSGAAFALLFMDSERVTLNSWLRTIRLPKQRKLGSLALSYVPTLEVARQIAMAFALGAAPAWDRFGRDQDVASNLFEILIREVAHPGII